MPFCSSCGKEIKDDYSFCPHCGFAPNQGATTTQEIPQETGAIPSLQKGFNIIMAKPMVLLPALIGAIISVFLSTIEFLYAPTFYPSIAISLGLGLISIIGAIISFIITFASWDMSRDAYTNQPLDLSRSINYVLSRIVTFILASILGAILSITIILGPIATLMFVILVLDETSIGNALSRAFNVAQNRLADIVILVIIAFVIGLILNLIPIIGSLLESLFGVIVGLAFIDIYYQYRKTTNY